MISVLICTYNRAKYLGPLLNSLAANDLASTAFEIVVVDNNCTDDTPQVCATFAQTHPSIHFHYCIEAEQGLSAARNRAIREAKGSILVYVDDDALVDTWYLRTIYEYLKSHPDISAVGGAIIPLYENVEEPKWMTRYTKELLCGYLYFGEEVRPFPGNRYPGGGNAAYRADVFAQVGLFNTNLGRKGNSLMGAEEKDIFDKMRNLGLKYMYLPKMILHHIIPPHKLERDYFNRLTLQIGRSERQRTKAVSGKKYLNRLVSELVKWGGVCVLLCFYTLCCAPLKGWKLVQFRYNVTKGLLGG